MAKPDGNASHDPEALIRAGSEIAGGGVVGAALGFLTGGPVGAALGGAGGATTPLLSRALRYVATEFRNRYLSPREEERVGATIAFVAQKVNERLSHGASLREDGFFQGDAKGRSTAEEIMEGVLLTAQREYEEKKLKYYGNLVANIAFHPEVDRGYASLLLKLASELSYRQLCVLRVFADKENFRLRDGDYRGQQDFNPGLVSLLHEIKDLFDRGLVSYPNDMLLGLSDVNPARMTVQGAGAMLHNLMELWELNGEDLDQVRGLLSQ